MRLVQAVVMRVVVMTVGVVLVAAPIFSSLQAQELNSQSQVLLTLQTLQQEIAELRDQVDRQNFEIRKLKRALAQQGAPSQTGVVPQNQVGYANPSLSNPNVVTLPSTSQASSNGLINPDQSNVATQTSQQQAQPVGVPQQYPTSSTASSASTSSAASPQDDFYNPYEPNASTSPSEVASASDFQVQNSAAVAREYPPVVDRSIGAQSSNVVITSDNGNVNTYVSPQVAVTPQAQGPAASSSIGNQPYAGGAAATSSVIDPSTQNLPSQAASGPVAGGPMAGSPVAGNSVAGSPVAGSPVAGSPVAGSPVVTIPPSQTQSQTVQVAGNQTLSTASQTNGSFGQPQLNAPVAQPPVQNVSEGDYYAQGFDLLKNSKYQEASDVFNKQLAEYPQGAQADDAHYWISEAMTMVNKTDVAKTHLNKIVTDFPQSSRIPDAKLRLAYIELRKGNDIEARILLQEIVSAFPQSNAAIAAKNRLAAIN